MVKDQFSVLLTKHLCLSYLREHTMHWGYAEEPMSTFSKEEA